MANTPTETAAAPPKRTENFKPERHNLFLSHAGEDKAFVRMLHEDLKKHHHSPFLDQERDSLPLGSHFPTEILEAICKCQVIVFVLSEHFVTKKWPMLELAEAWRQPDDKRPIMFPIFYKLEVGKIDKANLSEWCKVWKTQANKDPQVDCDAFSKALQNLTKYSGVRNSEGLDDFRFAKNVVSEICRQVTPDKLWVNDGMEKEEEICTELSGHLQDQSGNFRILGMWGGSGTGKTWIATALCRHFYKEYCGWVCFIDLSMRKDKLALVRAMYLSLSGEKLDKKIDSEHGAQKCLEEFIAKKSFFIVLDNPTLTQDCKGMVEFVLEILLNHCKECKVLITARDEKFLTSLLKPYSNTASVIQVPSLDEDAAAKILWRSACPHREWGALSPEEQTDILQVCRSYLEKFDFNPLLTRVLGKRIAQSGRDSKDPRCWPALVEANADFQKDLDSTVFSLLNEQFQSMAANLHLQAFYIDAALYDVAIETTLNRICQWLGIIHGCRPKTVLKKLQEVSHNYGLLGWEGHEDDEAELDGLDEDPEIITNDVFAKFAMSQVRENPEKWGWFFYSGVAEEEKTVQEGESSINPFAPPRPKKVKRIEKIALVGGKFQDVGEVLNLMHYTKAIAMVVSRCREVKELNVEWNPHLKVLEVENCEKLKEIEGLEDLTQLVCLRVVSTRIGAGEVALQLGKLRRLQKLQICHTPRMRKPPNLQGCFKLRQLFLEHNPHLESLPEGWSGFSHLTKISFAGNEKVVILPDLSPLASVLRHLDISCCTNLKSAACISSLTSLQMLCLDFCISLSLQLPAEFQALQLLLISNPVGVYLEFEGARVSIYGKNVVLDERNAMTINKPLEQSRSMSMMPNNSAATAGWEQRAQYNNTQYHEQHFTHNSSGAALSYRYFRS